MHFFKTEITDFFKCNLMKYKHSQLAVSIMNSLNAHHKLQSSLILSHDKSHAVVFVIELLHMKWFLIHQQFFLSHHKLISEVIS